VVAAPALLAVILGTASYGTNTLTIDHDVSQWVQARNASWADPLSTFGNAIGEAPVAIALLCASLLVGALLRWWQTIWFVLVVALARLCSVYLKGLFESPRPNVDQVRLTETFENLGFPSGHVLTSTLVAGTLVYIIGLRFSDHRAWIVLAGLWLVAIGCTAFARIWVGAHWLTDTVGGALFGIFIILLAANLSTLLVNWWPGRPSSAGP
jgi:undecaprenyl-diphosphatase